MKAPLNIAAGAIGVAVFAAVIASGLSSHAAEPPASPRFEYRVGFFKTPTIGPGPSTNQAFVDEAWKKGLVPINDLAAEGWRVVHVSPSQGQGYTTVLMERPAHP